MVECNKVMVLNSKASLLRRYTFESAHHGVMFLKNSGDTMIFTDKSCQLLKSMRIDPREYSNILQDEYGEDAVTFNSLIEQISGLCLEEPTTIHFNNFVKEYNVLDDSLIFNQLYAGQTGRVGSCINEK